MSWFVRVGQQCARLGAAVAIGFAVCSTATSAWAMRVSPMVAELTTRGAGSAARIEVGNIGSAALPFETRITRMEVDGEGRIVETPADDQFLVFPPQGVVSVGGRQMVRVQWVGSPDLDVSQAYYLSVRQLPVATDPNIKPEDGGAVQVQVLYNMKALLVVAPPGAEPKVEVVSVRPSAVSAPAPVIDPALMKAGEAPPAPLAEPGIEVVIGNGGKRYALMAGAKWIVDGVDVTGKPFHKEYSSEDISKTVGIGYVAPGGRRTFQLPTGVALDPSKPVTLKFGRA